MCPWFNTSQRVLRTEPCKLMVALFFPHGDIFPFKSKFASNSLVFKILLLIHIYSLVVVIQRMENCSSAVIL